MKLQSFFSIKLAARRPAAKLNLDPVNGYNPATKTFAGLGLSASFMHMIFQWLLTVHRP